MRTRALATALLTAVALAVTGCGGNDDGGDGAASAKAGKAAEESAGTGETDDAGTDAKDDTGAEGEDKGAKKVDAPESLNFSGKTLAGKSFDGRTLAGKPVVLWFWAPWCGSCRGQAPQTAELADEYKGKVNFVGVAGLDKIGPMRDFVSEMKVDKITHLDDQPGSIWKKFKITQQSAYVVLDKDGKTVHSGVPSGPDHLDDLVASIAD